MHQVLVCLCLSGLVLRGWTSEQSTELWKYPTHSGWWDDRYEPEETEASCCPIKKLGNRIYRMVSYNLTSAKQHDCKDGCIYHDSEGRETCFTQVSINTITNLHPMLPKIYETRSTQGKQDAFCHQEVIRAGETEKECSGTRRLDNKTALAIDADHTPWGPGAEVPYSMDSPRLLETDKQLFREAIAYIESLSCIR